MVGVVDIAAAFHGSGDLIPQLRFNGFLALFEILLGNIAEESQLIAKFPFQIRNMHAGVGLQRLDHIKACFDQIRQQGFNVAAAVHKEVNAVCMEKIAQLFMAGEKQLPIGLGRK